MPADVPARRSPLAFAMLALVFAVFVAMPWAVRPLEAAIGPERAALAGTIAETVLGAILAVWVLVLLRRMRRQARRHAAEIERLIDSDPLTGVGNRRAFEHELDRALHRARRTREPVSVLVFDVDDLAALRRAQGRAVAEHTLRMMGAVLRSSARFGVDAGFRIEPGQFAMVVAAEREGAETVSRRVEWNFRERSPRHSQISAGIVTWDGRGRAEDLLERARRALQAGRQAAALASARLVS